MHNIDWASLVIDKRSTSGYYTFNGGNLVAQRSKKQSVVARSSTEAEFRLMVLEICELVQLKSLMKELALTNNLMKFYHDNKATTNIPHNRIQQDRTKHVKMETHFIKEKQESDQICMSYISSKKQLEDILTKGLPRPQFQELISKLGMMNIYDPA